MKKMFARVEYKASVSGTAKRHISTDGPIEIQVFQRVQINKDTTKMRRRFMIRVQVDDQNEVYVTVEDFKSQFEKKNLSQ